MGNEETADAILNEAASLAEALRRGARGDVESALARVRRSAGTAGDAVERAAWAGLERLGTAGGEVLGGLAAQTGRLEPESLAARVLAQLADGDVYSNEDLVEMLESDPWQVSRAGRRLRELGLAIRRRQGRVNVWTVTQAGRAELGP